MWCICIYHSRTYIIITVFNGKPYQLWCYRSAKSSECLNICICLLLIGWEKKKKLFFSFYLFLFHILFNRPKIEQNDSVYNNQWQKSLEHFHNRCDNNRNWFSDLQFAVVVVFFSLWFIVIKFNSKPIENSNLMKWQVFIRHHIW